MNNKIKKEFQAYFVPKFPISKITNDGRDGWIDMPNHPKNVYGFLDAILEHIDNTNYIDPIRIVIHDENQVHVGPSGTSRLYALSHIRNHQFIPAIVSTKKYFDWFGEDVTKIDHSDQIRSYLMLEPVTYTIEPDGKAWWHNQNPNKDQMKETFKVSESTLQRVLKCI